MNQKLKGSLMMIASAILFGSMPLFVKNIYLGGANAISVVFYRNFLALPVLFFIMVKTSEEPLMVQREEIPKFFIVSSIGAALTPILMYMSYNYIDSAMSTTLHYINPIVVFLILRIFYQERLNRLKAFCLAATTFGILLFYTPGAPANAWGIFLALASGVTFAIYIVYLDKSGLSKMNPFRFSFYNALFCSVLVLVYALLTKSFTYNLTPMAWLLSIIFSLSLTVGAVILFQQGVQFIGPQNTALLSTFEPLTSIFWGVLVFKESFNFKTILGTILILAAAGILTLAEVKDINRQEIEIS